MRQPKLFNSFIPALVLVCAIIFSSAGSVFGQTKGTYGAWTYYIPERGEWRAKEQGDRIVLELHEQGPEVGSFTLFKPVPTTDAASTLQKILNAELGDNKDLFEAKRLQATQQSLVNGDTSFRLQARSKRTGPYYFCALNARVIKGELYLAIFHTNSEAIQGPGTYNYTVLFFQRLRALDFSLNGLGDERKMHELAQAEADAKTLAAAQADTSPPKMERSGPWTYMLAKGVPWKSGELRGTVYFSTKSLANQSVSIEFQPAYKTDDPVNDFINSISTGPDFSDTGMSVEEIRPIQERTREGGLRLTYELKSHQRSKYVYRKSTAVTKKDIIYVSVVSFSSEEARQKYTSLADSVCDSVAAAGVGLTRDNAATVALIEEETKANREKLEQTIKTWVPMTWAKLTFPAPSDEKNKAEWQALAALASGRYAETDFKHVVPRAEQTLISTPNIILAPDAPRITTQLLDAFDNLVDSGDSNLSLAAVEARDIFVSRRQIALANEQYGNTPANSLRGAPAMFTEATRHALLEAADESRAREQWAHDHPESPYGSYNVTPSVETQASWDRTLESVRNIFVDVRNQAQITGSLGYADMLEYEKQTLLWNFCIIPALRTMAGAATHDPVVKVDAGWEKLPREDTQRAYCINIKNISPKALHHVTVIINVRNFFNEATRQFYYIPILNAGSTVSALLSPRWDKRILEYSTTLVVRPSVICDELSYEGEVALLESPVPDLEGGFHRRLLREADQKFQKVGEAMGKMVQGLNFGLPVAERKNRLLTEILRGGREYLASDPQDEKKRMLSLKILSIDHSPNKFQVAVTTYSENKETATQELSGQITKSAEGGQIGRLENGWLISIGEQGEGRLTNETGKRGGPMLPAYLAKVVSRKEK